MASKELKEEIDEKLSKIGMSMKNKGLISYLDKGAVGPGVISRLYKAAIRTNKIQSDDALAYAISSANRFFNGGQISGLREMFLNPKGQVERLIEDPHLLIHSFKSMRRSTLEKYKKAVNILESFRLKKI